MLRAERNRWEEGFQVSDFARLLEAAYGCLNTLNRHAGAAIVMADCVQAEDMV